LNGIEINERLQSEVRVRDTEVSVDLLLNLFPMMLFESIISKSHDNRHSTFECVYLVLESSLNGVVIKVLFKSDTYLGVVISLLSDFFCLNIVELSLDPDFLELLPLLEGAPHNATEL
jgi:hypothetical protein